ncbi:hypothetical protein [Cyclobacterium xiamenense]|uniref:hypothetical protein n=1 Tax=Cyclobacterium xiamenense TaxID=1297121 RepID=UPI0035CF741C
MVLLRFRQLYDWGINGSSWNLDDSQRLERTSARDLSCGPGDTGIFGRPGMDKETAEKANIEIEIVERDGYWLVRALLPPWKKNAVYPASG